MFKERAEPNTASYSAAISACEKGSLWKLALKLLEDCAAWATVDFISYSAALSANERCA